MADDKLRPFYERACDALHPANNLRLALRNGDKDIIQAAAKRMAETASQIVEPFGDYETWEAQIWRMNDAWLAYEIWEHVPNNLPAPTLPPNPGGLTYEAVRVAVGVRRLNSFAENVIQRAEQMNREEMTWRERDLFGDIRDLLDRLDALRTMVFKAPDELIDRNQVAILTRIDAKTLKNNPQWLPDPVKRGKKGLPIYRYSEVRARLEKRRPDIASLPPYDEAMALVSSTGHFPATVPAAARSRPGAVP